MEWLFVKVIKLPREEAENRLEIYDGQHLMRKIAFGIGLAIVAALFVLLMALLILLMLEICGVISQGYGYSVAMSAIFWPLAGALVLAIVFDLIGRKLQPNN